ncbi:hypothetical protein NG791_22885 [Laspinema sp. D1]|uniref:hypothetical protein n=1 Tax=Laspinema palackyanum TaxID=3231601 RepID=UPI003487B7AB|nr:hypothetical protein [Laspinema sp. D2b]
MPKLRQPQGCYHDDPEQDWSGGWQLGRVAVGWNAIAKRLLKENSSQLGPLPRVIRQNLPLEAVSK